MSDAQENPKQPQQGKATPKQKRSFADCLKKCQLYSPELVEQWLAGHDSDRDNELASQLVRQEHLTSWQAKYLLSGRHRLHLGNYQLLERIRRDEFGDRFIALHPNLGRQVLIQVLPVQLTDDAHQRDAFLKRAGRVGELDHPNLTHVFDIDRDQGRYFLVTEHIAGQLLSDRVEGTLEAIEIGQIVRDAIAGLRHAHSHKITHGRVSRQSLLVTESGATKVTQIALSPLVTSTATNAPAAATVSALTPEQTDLAATIEIGKSCASQLVAVADRSQLETVLSGLSDSIANATAFERSFGALNEWVDASAAPIVIDADRDAEPPQVAPAIALATPDESQANPSVDVENGNASVEPSLAGKAMTDAAAAPAPKVKPDAGRSTPTAALLLGVSTLSLLIGGLGVAAFFWINGRSDQGSAKPQQQTIARLGPTDQAPIDSPPASLPTEPPQPLAPHASKITASAPATATRLLPEQRDALPPEDSSPKPISAIANVSETQPPSQSKPVIGPPKTPEASTDVAAAPQAPSPAVTKPAAETTAIAKPKPVAKLNPLAKPKPLGKPSAIAKTKTASAPKTETGDPPAGPFDTLPNAVDLPALDSLAAVEIATIPNSSNYLLGLELIAPEGVAPGKTVFELVRDEANKQRWGLNVKRSVKSKGHQIGQLDHSTEDANVTFQWTAEANKSKHADYVRNAALRVTVANESRTLNLRKPQTLADLKISATNMRATLESAVEHLPQPAMVTVELLPWKPAGLPKSWLDPAIVRAGQPAAIHFHEAASNQFCWLQLTSEMRGTASLQLQLLLKRADGSVVPLESAKQLTELARSIEEAARLYEQEYNGQKDFVAPTGHKTKFKTYLAKLKSNMTKAKKQTLIATENIEILNSVYNRSIPLRILFRSGDHRVVLAETTQSK